MSQYLAIQLDLSNRSVLIVGGGAIAQQKVQALLGTGARITVLAPELGPEMVGLAASGRVDWEAREFRRGDTAAHYLVIAATDEPRTNEAIANEARRHGVLLNVVDTPDLCDFIFPAVHRHGALQITVSTSGQSPALACWLRDWIAQQLEPYDVVALMDFLATWRRTVHKYLPDPVSRQRFWQEANRKDLPLVFWEDSPQTAAAVLREILT